MKTPHPPYRTPSSSGVSSGEADSASSSSSSICDSPPPLSKVTEEKESESPENKEATTFNNKATSRSAQVQKGQEQQPLQPESAESSKVVLRRRERSLASRRLVKSMYAESTPLSSMCGGAVTRGGMVDSLLSDSVTSSDRYVNCVQSDIPARSCKNLCRDTLN